MFCSTPCYLTSPIVLKSSLNCDSGYIFSRYHSKLWQLSFSRSFFLCITSPYSVFLTPGWRTLWREKRKEKGDKKKNYMKLSRLFAWKSDYFYEYTCTFRRVLHMHLPDCPGKVKSDLGKYFERPRNNSLPESGKLKVYCGHTSFNTKITLFSFWGKCFSLNLYFTCLNGQVVIKTYEAPCI